MDLSKYESMSISDLEQEIKILDLRQNAIKILINAAYGAFGNKYFYFANLDIAQSITLQGQDLIKFSVKAINHFFKQKWHTYTELHQKLGIDHLIINQIDKDAVIYVDTDSNYVCFNYAIKSIENLPTMTEEELIQFCLKIDEFGLKPYLKAAFIKYASVFNTENRQDFELENISRSAVWMAKKNYALEVWFEDNANRDLLKPDKRYKIIKGLETVKSSYPIWARTKLGSLQDIFLKKGTEVNIEVDIIPLLKTLKEEFMSLPIDQICFNANLNEYEKYIIDLKTLDFNKGQGPNPRGSAYYNYMLWKTGSLKYNPIREKTKIKVYECDPTQNENNFEVFAFPPGEFPEEFAPPIDRTQMFFKLIIEPVNRFLEAYGWLELDKYMGRVVEFIKPRTKKPIAPEDYYPLHVVDSEKFDYMEIPEKFNEFIGNPNIEVPANEFNEYISIIAKYGLNSVIVPKSELQKYIKRRKNKIEKDLQKKELNSA